MPPTKREETPDVLGQLLGGQKPAAPPEEEPISEEEPQAEAKATSKPAKQQASKTVRQRARKPAPAPEPAPEEPKLKATFYLSPSTLDALEAGWLQLRRLAVLDERGRVSKSAIVEASLLAALEELKAKAEKSQLASRVAGQ